MRQSQSIIGNSLSNDFCNITEPNFKSTDKNKSDMNSSEQIQTIRNGVSKRDSGQSNDTVIQKKDKEYLIGIYDSQPRSQDQSKKLDKPKMNSRGSEVFDEVQPLRKKGSLVTRRYQQEIEDIEKYRLNTNRIYLGNKKTLNQYYQSIFGTKATRKTHMDIKRSVLTSNTFDKKHPYYRKIKKEEVSIDCKSKSLLGDGIQGVSIDCKSKSVLGDGIQGSSIEIRASGDFRQVSFDNGNSALASKDDNKNPKNCVKMSSMDILENEINVLKNPTKIHYNCNSKTGQPLNSLVSQSYDKNLNFVKKVEQEGTEYTQYREINNIKRQYKKFQPNGGQSSQYSNSLNNYYDDQHFKEGMNVSDSTTKIFLDRPHSDLKSHLNKILQENSRKINHKSNGNIEPLYVNNNHIYNGDCRKSTPAPSIPKQTKLDLSSICKIYFKDSDKERIESKKNYSQKKTQKDSMLKNYDANLGSLNIGCMGYLQRKKEDFIMNQHMHTLANNAAPSISKPFRATNAYKSEKRKNKAIGDSFFATLVQTDNNVQYANNNRHEFYSLTPNRICDEPWTNSLSSNKKKEVPQNNYSNTGLQIDNRKNVININTESLRKTDDDKSMIRNSTNVWTSRLKNRIGLGIRGKTVSPDKPNMPVLPKFELLPVSKLNCESMSCLENEKEVSDGGKENCREESGIG